MPILSDNAKLSIDFSYEWVSPDGSTFEYQMRFMHSANGPVIQIINEMDTLEFPAQMFVETAEFLVTQGVLKGGLPVSTKKGASPQLGIPSMRKGGWAQQKEAVKPPVTKTPVPNVAPFHSFGQDADQVDEPDGLGDVEMDEPTPTAPLPRKQKTADRPKLSGKEGVSEEEAEEITRARLKAKAENKAAEKKLQKRHRPADE